MPRTSPSYLLRDELPQVQVIRYLTERILYEGEVTPRTMESFLSALWPEEREAIIYGEFVDRVQDTRCITPITLKGLLVALSSLINVPAVRYGPVARWTLCQAHNIIHLGNQIQLEEDVTQETMDWFVRALWPNSSSQAATMTQSLCHSVYSTLPVDSVDEHLASPAVRDRFVQLVLGATEITDSILDWLYDTLFRTAREGSPWVDGEDPFSDDKDKSDMLDEETSGDDNPSRTQSDLSCDSSTADSDKENMLPSQSPAGFKIWDSGSTTPDNKSFDYLGGSAIKERSQFEGTAESLLQLSRDTLATANPFMDASYSLADNNRLHAGPAPGTELQRMPAKRSQVEEGNDGPRKRVKRSGNLIFTISAVHIIRKESGEAEALSYDNESGVWIDLNGVEYEFDDGRFTAASVAYATVALLYLW
ncbi:hypothetical protein F4802DRAFT_607791 [Xylaria palmicola]|nr:hypothetical protein F4802DRAFT_607791 [Xylaria palmicola]